MGQGKRGKKGEESPSCENRMKGPKQGVNGCQWTRLPPRKEQSENGPGKTTLVAGTKGKKDRMRLQEKTLFRWTPSQGKKRGHEKKNKKRHCLVSQLGGWWGQAKGKKNS